MTQVNRTSWSRAKVRISAALVALLAPAETRSHRQIRMPAGLRISRCVFAGVDGSAREPVRRHGVPGERRGSQVRALADVGGVGAPVA